MPRTRVLSTLLAFVLMRSGQIFAQELPADPPPPNDDPSTTEEVSAEGVKKRFVCGYGRIHFVGLGALGANPPLKIWGKLLIATEFMPNLQAHPRWYGETTFGTKIIEIRKSENNRMDFLIKMKALLTAASINAPVRIAAGMDAFSCSLDSKRFEIKLCSSDDCLRDFHE